MRSAAPGPAPMKCTVMARLRGDAASAQVAAPTTSRGTISARAGRPRRARRLPRPSRRRQAPARVSEWVSTRSLAASSRSCGTTTTETPNVAAAALNAGFAALWPAIVAMTSSAPASTCARASAARMAASISRRRSAAPASDAGDDHGLTHDHWVTGIAGRQPVLSPTASAREIAMRINSPPSRRDARAAAPRFRASPH